MKKKELGEKFPPKNERKEDQGNKKYLKKE